MTVLELPARFRATTEALAEVEDLLARGDATDLVVVPELAFTGYVSPLGDFNLTRLAEPLHGPTITAVKALCQKRRIHFVSPLVLRELNHVYNACVLVGPKGDIQAVYRKRHPWFPEAWATPGREPLPIITINDVKLTIAICYDGHFLAFDSADILRECDLLLFLSAWVDEEDSRLPLLRAIAKDFHVAIANANWCEGVVCIPGQGGSCILDAKGQVMKQVPLTKGASRIDAVISSSRKLRD